MSTGCMVVGLYIILNNSQFCDYHQIPPPYTSHSQLQEGIARVAFRRWLTVWSIWKCTCLPHTRLGSRYQSGCMCSQYSLIFPTHQKIYYGVFAQNTRTVFVLCGCSFGKMYWVGCLPFVTDSVQNVPHIRYSIIPRVLSTWSNNQVALDLIFQDSQRGECYRHGRVGLNPSLIVYLAGIACEDCIGCLSSRLVHAPNHQQLTLSVAKVNHFTKGDGSCTHRSSAGVYSITVSMFSLAIRFLPPIIIQLEIKRDWLTAAHTHQRTTRILLWSILTFPLAQSQ